MDYEKIIINVLKLIYFIFNNVVQAHGCFLQYAIFKVEVGRIGLIKKKKRIKTTYEKYAQLIWNFLMLQTMSYYYMHTNVDLLVV